jgi:hypothetical protein
MPSVLETAAMEYDMSMEHTALHTEEDKEKNRGQIKRWLILFLAFAVLGMALIAVSFSIRDATHINNPNETLSQALTIAITLVWGGLLIFFWGMKLTPHLCYRRFLKDVYSGMSRAVEGCVVGFEENTTFREGLLFYRLIVNVGDLKNPEDERLLYWDARLSRPALQTGARVRAVTRGNDIIGFCVDPDGPQAG